MKRLFLFVFAALAFAACEQAPIEEQSSAGKLGYDAPDTIYASLDDDATRTYVEQGKYLRWHAGDEISFFPVTHNMQYQFQGETGDNNGAFKKLTTDLITGNELNNNYAVYPYKESTAMSDEGVISFELPAEQGYAENSFGLGANTMVAITSGKDDNILRFKNACGYLKLNLYGEDVCVKSIMFKGNNDERIAGAATITAIYGNDPVVTMNEEATTTITLDCGDGVALGTTEETATAFWFVIPVTTFEEGFTVTVTDTEGGVFEKSTSSNLTIERNHIQPMKALEVEQEVIIPETWKIYYTAYEKVAADSSYPWTTDTFGANVVSHEWNSETREGVITFDADVTTIGNHAFAECHNLASITIPDSVTTIGDYAFETCASLESITIPDSVTTIGVSAFDHCLSLANITIPDSVTSIGDSAFSSCWSLTSVTIPDSITTIGEDTFYECKSLTSVTIPDSVTSIGYSAFYECKSLMSVYCKATTPPTGEAMFVIDDWEGNIFVPAESIETYKTTGYWRVYANLIVGYDFEKGEVVPEETNNNRMIAYTATEKIVKSEWKFNTFGANIVSHEWDSETGEGVITFDADVTAIGSNAFYGLTLILTNITIPNSVTTIGDSAFQGCVILTSITIPNGVTTIGYGAFADCYSLTSVTIPDSVTTIGDTAFSSCRSLTSVTIGKSVTTIGDGAFSTCRRLTSVTIPDSVTTIGEGAFSTCDSLTSVTIGDSVTEIGYSAFYYCESLAKFNGKFAEDNGRILVIDGTLVAFAPAGITEYSIPDGVTSIGNSAFYLCNSLTNVTIPDSVTAIGVDAFAGCRSLTSVYCKATTPPALGGTYVIGGSDSGRKIYVPTASVYAYKSAEYWSAYADYIIGYDFE